MESSIYKNYVFGLVYPVINLQKDEQRLKLFLADAYGFELLHINILTFIYGHSRRPYYLDRNNHYILFKVKENVFLSIDGELKLLGKEG